MLASFAVVDEAFQRLHLIVVLVISIFLPLSQTSAYLPLFKYEGLSCQLSFKLLCGLSIALDYWTTVCWNENRS